MTTQSRYSRQTLIEGWNQEKISRSQVAVIGLGALGSIVAANLTMIGVRKILLIDHDTIEISNLSRQLLYHQEHIGEPKVVVAAKQLSSINPEVEVVPIQKKVENVPLHLLAESTCLVEGLDTFEARRYVNALALSLKKPLVSGGIYAFNGNIQVIIPYETPCLECQPLIPIERLQKSCTRPEEVNLQVHDEQSQLNNELQMIPTVAPVSTVIGGMMAQECVKLLLGLPHLKEYLFWDAKSQTFTKIPLNRRENCFACSDKFRLKGIPLSLSLNETLAELLQRVKILFNLKNPSLAIESRMLGDEETRKKIRELLSSYNFPSFLFIFDESLPKPLKIIPKVISE